MKNKYVGSNFDDFLFNLTSPKLFIFHVLDSYSFLLNSLFIPEITYISGASKLMFVNETKNNFIIC